MQSIFLRLARQNDSQAIEDYLQKNIPDARELDSRVRSPQTTEEVKKLLLEYQYLLTHNLHDTDTDDCTVLMIIIEKNYIPLLNQKINELDSKKINHQCQHYGTALDLAVSQDNISLMILLINNGADMYLTDSDSSPYEIIIQNLNEPAYYNHPQYDELLDLLRLYDPEFDRLHSILLSQTFFDSEYTFGQL